MKDEVEIREQIVLAVVEGVENPDLDVRVAIELQNALIAGLGIAIVHEDAHAHPAIRGVPQLLGEERPRLVSAENEVLQIEGALGISRDLYASGEAVDAALDEMKTGQPGVRLREIEEVAPESRLAWILQRRRDRLAGAWCGQGGTARRQDGGDKRRQRQQHCAR